MMNCFYKMETELELLGATGIEDRLSRYFNILNSVFREAAGIVAHGTGFLPRNLRLYLPIPGSI